MKTRWGAVAMAALAVLSLGATVFVAHRALSEASDVVVRGEGDLLMSTVISEIVDEGPPTAALLERELAAHQRAGLRYIAIIDREGRASLEAGEPELESAPIRPGQSVRLGRRIRLTGPLISRRGPPPMILHRPPLGGIPLVAMEFEPPVIEMLRNHLTHIAIVAAGAGGVLLAFAIAWSRSAARLAEIERKAMREQRLVALGSMSSVMAHELRNPLASLKGHAQLLVEDLDGTHKRKAELVVREAERLEGLTTSLLDFVRDGPIERASVTPATLIARALADLAAERVRVDLAKAPTELLVDEARLARAIHNIVDNALQAADADVDLRTFAQDSEVVIEVRDRGPGLPPDAPIFEPFVTTRVKGTGLGLAVARRIAEQHDGSLVGENHPDGGAIFTLRFPVERR